MNTALIIEPRFLEKVPGIIHEFQRVLGQTWKVVFYCGHNLAGKWSELLNKTIEIRELDVTNFNTDDEYSDFVKQKELWESLYGEYVLIFQSDTWILSQEPYNIDFFINKNKSYIGGNMKYIWAELSRSLNNMPPIRNFNGGLSLRKREHMLEIIDVFPPLKTSKYTNKFEHDPEDVYFVLGCYNLGFQVGDDEECQHFALHTIYKEKCFCIHKPYYEVRSKLLVTNPEIANCYLMEGDIDPPLLMP